MKPDSAWPQKKSAFTARPCAYWLINALIFVCALAVMHAVSARSRDYLEDGVYFAYTTSSYVEITYNEITALEKYLIAGDMHLSYEVFGETDIGSEKASAVSKMIYTNEEYVFMNKLLLTNGRFFTKHDNMRDVIVLSEALAWKLFGDTHASGLDVMVGDTLYEVIGIISTDGVTSDDYYAWLQLEWDRGDSYVPNLYIQPGKYDMPGGSRRVIAALEKTLNYPRNYHVTDINAYSSRISDRFITALSLFGLYAAVVLIVRVIAVARKSDFIRAAAYSVAVIIILVFVDLRIPQSIPDARGFKGFVDAFLNQGLLPSREYLPMSIRSLWDINIRSCVAFITGAVALVNMAFMTYAGGSK